MYVMKTDDWNRQEAGKMAESSYELRYLNNSGHRWVYIDKNGNRKKYLVFDGVSCRLRALTFEATGNFVVGIARIKGVRQVCACRDDDVWIMLKKH